MTEQAAASDQVGTGQAEAERPSEIEAPDRSGSTTSDRGSQDIAPAQDDLQTEQSGDVAEAAEKSRAAEEVRSEDRDTDETDSGSDKASGDEPRQSDEDRHRAAEEFAREHDPEQHDVSAGEEFRQAGDWTAEDAGGPQVWDAEGNLVEGSAPGATTTAESAQGESNSQRTSDQGSASNRRTSDLDEIRDGGYGVGSAAPLDDGALPLGHPVKAWEDTKTFVTPDHDKYHEADPHVWFTDADAAQRAGFRPVD